MKKGRTYLEKEHDRSVVQLAAMADANFEADYHQRRIEACRVLNVCLALDIDGTLVNSRDELTPATSAAIRRACDAGIRVVLGHRSALFKNSASGRAAETGCAADHGQRGAH